MARKVIKCGFCSEDFELWESALRHETGCDFNPANKGCWTCEKFKDCLCEENHLENENEIIHCHHWIKQSDNSDSENTHAT